MPTPPLTLLQIIAHLAGGLPLAWLLFDFFTDNLTANPIQALEQRTGQAAIVFLLLSLACTPLATLTGWQPFLQRRKALGLYGFWYATLHVGAFFIIDYGLNLAQVWRDVGNKWYILIGATAFSLLLPVAATSFKYWMKRLGKNWKRLHRLVYVIAPLGILHYLLASKGDFTQLQGNLAQPLLYGALAAALLLLRWPPVKRAVLRWRAGSA